MKKISLIISAIVLTTIFSCTKEDSSLAMASQETTTPSNSGVLRVKEDGTFSFSNEILIKNYSHLSKAFQNASKTLSPLVLEKNKLSKDLPVDLVLEIKNGKIISSDNTIIPTGMWADNFLVEYGDVDLINNNFEITFQSDGSFTTNNNLPNNFVVELNSRFLLGGNNLKSFLNNEESITLSVNNYGNLVSSREDIIPNGNIKDNIPPNPNYRWNWDEFKACVGEYWYAPGVNVIACGIGCAIGCNDK